MKFAKMLAYLTTILYGLGAFITADLNFVNWTIEMRVSLSIVWVVGILLVPMFVAMMDEM